MKAQAQVFKFEKFIGGGASFILGGERWLKNQQKATACGVSHTSCCDFAGTQECFFIPLRPTVSRPPGGASAYWKGNQGLRNKDTENQSIRPYDPIDKEVIIIQASKSV